MSLSCGPAPGRVRAGRDETSRFLWLGRHVTPVSGGCPIKWGRTALERATEAFTCAGRVGLSGILQGWKSRSSARSWAEGGVGDIFIPFTQTSTATVCFARILRSLQLYVDSRLSCIFHPRASYFVFVTVLRYWSRLLHATCSYA